MLFFSAANRLTFLADGPVTAVAAFCASQGEREAAFSRLQAQSTVARLCRDALDGCRTTLVEIYELAVGYRSSSLDQIPTHFLVDRVVDAVNAGRLLLVPGWFWTSGYAAAAARRDDASTLEDRIARRIMARQAHLSFGGVSYLIIPAAAWAEVKKTGQYQAVHPQEAGGILKGIAAHDASSDRKAALEEAASHLVPAHAPKPGMGRDGRPPLQPGGLILLRRISVQVAVTGTEKPITPSQMLQIIKEHEKAAKKVDFVLELRTDDGYPIPEAAYEATLADGELRKGVLERDGTTLLEGVSPGPVLVRYPDDDDVSAKAWAVYARRALDRQDFFPVFSLLQRSPTSLRHAIQAYDRYFNDYTGAGFLRDLDTVFTDPDAHTTVATLLASAKIPFSETIELIGWDEQDGA